jgi:uncharacterized protein (DUF488 family)
MGGEIFTIGHSNHALSTLLELLGRHGIAAVTDVRSSPYSRHNPQFNREPLERALRDAGIAYVHLGRELGGRPADPACYVDGKVRFDLIARTPLFQGGLKRLRTGMRTQRICILCAEKDPITCHRFLHVSRNLAGPGIAIRHILEDGSLEDHAAAERRLLELLNIPERDLFAGTTEQVEKACAIQAARITRNAPAPE